MPEPALGELPDSWYAELSKPGCSVRYAGLPAMSESRELSSADWDGPVYSGVPELPDSSDVILPAAERSGAVHDAGHAAMPESLWNRRTATVPADAWYAVVSEPVRHSGAAALSADARDAVVPEPMRNTWHPELSADTIFALHDAWHAAVSEPACHELHPGNAAMS
jgi:hypothetical protein